MTRMAQNEMTAMRGMPLRVRSTEGLGDSIEWGALMKAKLPASRALGPD